MQAATTLDSLERLAYEMTKANEIERRAAYHTSVGPLVKRLAMEVDCTDSYLRGVLQELGIAMKEFVGLDSPNNLSSTDAIHEVLQAILKIRLWIENPPINVLRRNSVT